MTNIYEKRERVAESPVNVIVVQARLRKERIIQESATLNRLAKLAGVHLTFVNPLTENRHPWEDPERMLTGAHGIIFMGSADIDLTVPTHERKLYLHRAGPLADVALRRGTDPDDSLHVLGVCLGDQMLHERAGGKIGRNPTQAEAGTTAVVLNERGVDDPVILHVPQIVRNDGKTTILQVFGHKDSKVQLGEGFVVLGSTERDPYSLTRRGRILGNAGHPEITDVTELRTIVDLSNDHSHRKTALDPYELTYPLENAPDADLLIASFFQTVYETASA